MRQCVKYIHNPDMTLNFSPHRQIYKVFDKTSSFLSFDIVVPYLAHECITMQ